MRERRREPRRPHNGAAVEREPVRRNLHRGHRPVVRRHRVGEVQRRRARAGGVDRLAPHPPEHNGERRCAPGSVDRDLVAEADRDRHRLTRRPGSVAVRRHRHRRHRRRQHEAELRVHARRVADGRAIEREPACDHPRGERAVIRRAHHMAEGELRRARAADVDRLAPLPPSTMASVGAPPEVSTVTASLNWTTASTVSFARQTPSGPGPEARCAPVTTGPCAVSLSFTVTVTSPITMPL